MVSLSYLPKNQPPKIVNFTIEKNLPHHKKTYGGKGRRQDRSKTSDARNPKTASPGSSKKNVQWDVEDPNNDSLQLTIYFKGEDEKAWKVMDENTQKKALIHGIPCDYLTGNTRLN